MSLVEGVFLAGMVLAMSRYVSSKINHMVLGIFYGLISLLLIVTMILLFTFKLPPKISKSSKGASISVNSA